jgi:peroxiredoxin
MTNLRRYLTGGNAFTAAMVIVAAFLLARRQGYFLPAPSLEGLTRTPSGQEAPHFTLSDLEGRPVRLADLRGKVVLLNFWATWCPPCRAEMPSMEGAYRAYRDRGFTILAVAGDRQGAPVVAPFMREYGLTFPTVLDVTGAVAARYRVRTIPTTLLLDREGRIVAREVGARDWNGSGARAVIETLLAGTSGRKEAQR